MTLDESKAYLMEGRSASLVEETGCAQLHRAVCSGPKSDPSRALDRRIVDAITTNETLFFRDTAPFDLLRHKIVPELIDRRRAGRRPHPHLERRLLHRPGTLQHRDPAQGTAGRSRPLRRPPAGHGHFRRAPWPAPAAGVFSAIEISRGLERRRSETDTFAAPPAAGRFATRSAPWPRFKKLNLMQDFSALGRFDVIFCRNVAIYFTERDRISLFGRIERALEPDGYLVIGAMESLNGICPQFESKRHLRSVFYQVKTLELRAAKP